MNNSKFSARSNSSSPNKSPTRGLPETHIIQDRYRSYHRAEDYIKHLNNIYNTHVASTGVYDEAYFNAHQFRIQEPHDYGKYKVSQFPRSKVNQELLEQQEIFNAFNHISLEARPKSKMRPRSTMNGTHRRSVTEKTSFSYKQVKHILNQKCEECRKIPCQCPKDIKDNFLKNVLKRHKKVMQKANNGSPYGNLNNRKSLYIIKNNDKKTLTPSRSDTYDELRHRTISWSKKNEKIIMKPSRKKRTPMSPTYPIEPSLCISPISISQRSALKDKYNKLTIFKKYIQGKILDERYNKPNNK